MARNGLLDEGKDAQWPLPSGVFPGFDKVRLTMTHGELLDALKPKDAGRGEFLTKGALKGALMAEIWAGRFDVVHDVLGKLLGRDTPDGPSQPKREVG